jgi:hypothetical protein
MKLSSGSLSTGLPVSHFAVMSMPMNGSARSARYSSDERGRIDHWRNSNAAPTSTFGNATTLPAFPRAVVASSAGCLIHPMRGYLRGLQLLGRGHFKRGHSDVLCKFRLVE